jgi:ribosome-binding protein aMBF1 (putative translation factor)
MEKPSSRAGMNLNKKISEDIVRNRREAGLSQAELAHRLKTKQEAVSRFENGNYNFTVKALVRIATVLNKKIRIKFV